MYFSYGVRPRPFGVPRIPGPGMILQVTPPPGPFKRCQRVPETSGAGRNLYKQCPAGT